MSSEMPIIEETQEKIQSKTESGELPHESIEVYGEKVEIVDYQPEENELKTEVPVVYAKGWGVTLESHKSNIKQLGKSRRVLAADSPHGIESKNVPEEMRTKVVETLEDIPEIQLAKVITLLKMMEEKGLKQTDVVAHSEGGIIAIFAAMLRPDLFRNMVLVDPAGMIGGDKKWNLIGRASTDLLLQIKRIWDRVDVSRGVTRAKKTGVATLDLNRVIAAGPKRTWGSIGEIAGEQIQELISGVRSLGIKVSIVHAVDDNFFPMERVQKIVGGDGKGKALVDGFYSVQGTHNELYLNPEKYTKLADQALDALEDLRQKEEAAKK